MLKDSFQWDEVVKTAFQDLKSAIIRVLVLALPNFSKQFVVETNASAQGLGAVLMQDNHPIAFFSKVLPQSAKQKSVYEIELMAIVFAIQKWRHYLLSRHFVVHTDQRSLKFLLEQRLVNEDHQK